MMIRGRESEKKTSFMKPSQLYRIKKYTELRLKHMLLFISLHTHNNITEEYKNGVEREKYVLGIRFWENCWIGHERACVSYSGRTLNFMFDIKFRV